MVYQIESALSTILSGSLMQHSHMGHQEIAMAHSAASQEVLAVQTVRNLNLLHVEDSNQQTT